MSSVISGPRLQPESPAAADPTPCLIVNPRSYGAARNGLSERALALAAAYGATACIAEDPQAMAEALERAAKGQRSQVFLLAGDGSVQAAVDHLARRPGPLPRLLLIGGGRTNLTPRDLGLRRPVLQTLESALERWRRGEPFKVEERQTLRVEQPPAPPRHGFFFAGGLVDAAIRACHRQHRSGPGLLRSGHLGSTWTLLALAARGLSGRRSLPIEALQVEAAGFGALPGPARLVVATTLPRRNGLIDPYADRGFGGLRVTAIAARGPAFWAGLPRILSGRFTPQMTAERGYLSGRCADARISGLATYCLDGEEFDADRGRPIVITLGRRIAFLKP